MSEDKTKIKDPVIAVQRSSKSIACFNGFQIVREFQHYEDEKKAVGDARMWFSYRCHVPPRIVYPEVKRMSIK